MNISVSEINKSISKYLKALEGTIEYITTKYTGYKVYSKMYAEVTERKEYLSILVNKKFLTDEEVNKFDIKIVPENNKWTLNAEIRIYSLENIKEYKELLFKCYEKTKNSYKESLSNKIKEAIESDKEFIDTYSKKKEFAFQKLIDKWNEFNSIYISNNSLDELKSDIESSRKFNSNDFINKYKDKEEKYKFLEIVYEIIAYIDFNAYRKNVYNEYEDNRTLALTSIRQHEWVKNLINYKKYKDLNKVSEVARNVIIYILNPEKAITAFQTNKIMKFTNLLRPNISLDKNYEKLCEIIYEELKEYDIRVENEKNRGIIYGRIMFFKDIRKLWDKENNFFKMQPFKLDSQILKEEIEKNLEENIIPTKGKKINLNSSTKNIFYVADENKILFLALIISEIKEENGLNYYKFIKLKDSDKKVDLLPAMKQWGSKYTSRSMISVNEEEKYDFEREVINYIFEEDLDTLIDEINNMNIEIGERKIEAVNEDEEVDLNLMEDGSEEYVFEKEIDTPLNIILYGPPGTGKTYNTINYAVSIVEKKEVEEIIEESKKNREEVFKRYKNYIAEKRIVFTTFHQNYSYEDFIQGIKANINNTDQLSFVKEDGIFKDIVERAKNDLENNYVLIIDEINRGNISRIFGELITLIEEDKRLGQLNETVVTLPSKEVFIVPPNLYILGTMNTADRSIANIDIALRRRFDFIPMYPDYSLIPEFEGILRSINNSIYEKKKSADYLIGHAFFMNKSKEDIGKIINNKVIPLLNEYFYMNREEVKEILIKSGIRVKENLDNFQIEYDGIEEE